MREEREEETRDDFIFTSKRTNERIQYFSYILMHIYIICREREKKIRTKIINKALRKARESSTHPDKIHFLNINNTHTFPEYTYITFSLVKK